MGRVVKRMGLIFLVLIISLVFAMSVSAENQIMNEGIYGYTVNNNEATIMYVDDYKSESIVIPDKLGGYTVSSIHYSAFSFCTSLERIIVDECSSYFSNDENGVLYNKEKTELLYYPIAKKDSVFSIPDGVKTIGTCAFVDAVNLTEIIFAESVEVISELAFNSCNGLVDVVIGSGVKTIKDNAFENCINLETVYFSSSVQQIGKFVFIGSNKISKIIVNENNNNYSNDECGVLFNKDKTELIYYPIGSTETKYTIPNGVLTIGDYAISGAVNLEKLKMSESVEKVGICAFESCINLIELNLSENLKEIGYRAFANCLSIETITLPVEITEITDYAFEHCASLKNVIFKGEITLISTGAFMGCYNLTAFEIPNSVIYIGPHAFSDCLKLEEVIIPTSVEKISEGAFFRCNSLKDIYVYGVDTIIGEFGLSITNYTIEGISYDEYIEKDIQSFKFYVLGDEEKSHEIADDLMNYYICPDPEVFRSVGTIYCYRDSNAKKYAVENGVDYKYIDNEHIHTPETIIIPHSCTVPGMQYDICSDCGQTIGMVTVIPAAHTPGEWEEVVTPTYELEGKKVIKCIICGEILQEEAIPKLKRKTIVDEKTDISIDFDGDEYDGEVDIIVEDCFDGTAFNLVNTETGGTKSFIYDIKMTLNGENIQPNGMVTVKIPLPEGCDPQRCFIYYANVENGRVERIEARYEDGYMVFETDHFSYYAIVEVPDIDNCSCNCHASGIKKFFFNFILFFQKLFKKNAVCACGVAHY